MDPKERDEKLEKWLDDALANYSEAEPQWGFEQRVLAKVRAEDSPKKISQWRWVAIAALAAAIVVAFVLPRSRRTATPGVATVAPNVTRQATVAPPVAQVPPKIEARSNVRAAARVTHSARLANEPKEEANAPRQAVFPAPTPMTAEERMAMAFASHTPSEADKAAKARQEPPVAPQKLQDLTIQAIKIEPLEAGILGGETR